MICLVPTLNDYKLLPVPDHLDLPWELRNKIHEELIALYYNSVFDRLSNLMIERQLLKGRRALILEEYNEFNFYDLPKLCRTLRENTRICLSLDFQLSCLQNQLYQLVEGVQKVYVSNELVSRLPLLEEEPWLVVVL